MKLILAVGKMILAILLPRRIYLAVVKRLIMTRNIYRANKSTKLVVRVITFPIKWLVDFVHMTFKIICVWVMRTPIFYEYRQLYSSFRNIINEFAVDLTSRMYPFKTACERLSLRMEMNWKGRKKIKSFGDKNADKVFYVIRPFYFYKPNVAIIGTQHLLSNYFTVVHHLATALDWDAIPVVDWENYKLPHSEDEPVNGTMNAWEYFWEQPSEYTLEEVYKSKHVILSEQRLPNTKFVPPMRVAFPIERYAEQVIQAGKNYADYLCLNERTLEHIDQMQQEIFPVGARILGVALRGTSYCKKKYLGHFATQPDLEELLELMKHYKKEWDMDYIFFTNEENETVEYIKKQFGNEVIIMPRIRYTNYHKYSDNDPNPNDSDLNPLFVKGQRYYTSLDYLTEMVLLSKCNALLGAMSGGVRAALFWNRGNYEHVEIIDKGATKERGTNQMS